MKNKGMAYAFGAYLLWGVLPVYLKLLKAAPAMQILGHRIVWSVLLLAVIVSMRREWSAVLQAFRSRRTLVILFFAACLLAMNWITYIWGVNAGFVIETSLGYFS